MSPVDDSLATGKSDGLLSIGAFITGIVVTGVGATGRTDDAGSGVSSIPLFDGRLDSVGACGHMKNVASRLPRSFFMLFSFA
jgi:hypothetical protein